MTQETPRTDLNSPPASADFPTHTAGLPEARSPEAFELSDGEQFDLRIAPVAKKIGHSVVRMLAYNGSIPGPTLRVQQGSELAVNVVNEGDLEATVHWHGLRLDNRYDGTAQTQQPMAVGGSFSYRLKFPDPGSYWYHPHIREDYGQELGLYANIVVVPSEPEYWPPVNRELTLTLDDILLEDGRVAPFSRSQSTYTAMGRFGNVLLVNGEPELSLTARRGEVVRFYLTCTANTRVFNVAARGARMKLVGGDSGHYEREEFVESVLIGPSERAVVDVLFDQPGQVVLEHRTPNRTYQLTTITVADEPADPSLLSEFGRLRTNSDMAAERDRLAPFLDAEPDKTLAFVAEMNMGEPELSQGAMVAYVCPMHPEVSSHEPGRCPECGMKLVPAHLMQAAHHEPHQAPPRALHDEHRQPYESSERAEHDEHRHEHAGGEHARDVGGIEWEDDMVEVNRMTTPANTRWKLMDRATGSEGAAIDWRFRVGQRVKIRLVNEMDSDHPMHHPFHIHGAGRFLVLSRDGLVEPNLVWKDTVLVRTGQTVDILFEATNPGLWMAHCHIAEHHESGMMFSFAVEP
jgi:FtsP/CotA-like multicopper oxidase with cupredoxin domain